MKKFSEKLEWGRFYNPDVKEFLDDIFIEYTNPLDKRYIGDATTHRIKSGTNMMVLYVVEIPIRECNADILINILEDLKVVIERIKIEVDISYSIKLIDGKIKLNLWSRD
jgi:hypothetical protein